MPSPPQILVNDVDEIVGRHRLRGIRTTLWVNDMFPNVVLDHLGNEAIERPAAGRRLLQYPRTLVIRLNRALNCFDLTAQSFDAVEQLVPILCDMSHATPC
jgi:hypothetical protein